MIENSFILFEGIGNIKEQNLWRSGVLDWDAFTNCKRAAGISYHRKAFYDRQINKASKNLYAANMPFFQANLPSAEHWRLYDFFKEDAVFLDIETTGLGDHHDITMVGLFDGFDTKIMIKDINLNMRALREELQKYKMIVTFNGRSFDIPFIERRFPGTIPAVPHLDLRHLCARIGLTGGLKRIEKELGVKRRKLVGDLTGGDAVTLWRMYKHTGDGHYLNLLVEYNEEDIINLKKLANFAFGELKTRLLG